MKGRYREPGFESGNYESPLAHLAAFDDPDRERRVREIIEDLMGHCHGCHPKVIGLMAVEIERLRTEKREHQEAMDIIGRAAALLEESGRQVRPHRSGGGFPAQDDTPERSVLEAAKPQGCIYCQQDLPNCRCVTEKKS